MTLLLLNKVTNHHAQQNRVNTVSVIGGMSVHGGSETPNGSTLEKYLFFCACGSWLLHFQLEQLARLYLYRTTLLMPSRPEKCPHVQVSKKVFFYIKKSINSVYCTKKGRFKLILQGYVSLSIGSMYPRLLVVILLYSSQ